MWLLYCQHSAGRVSQWKCWNEWCPQSVVAYLLCTISWGCVLDQAVCNWRLGLGPTLCSVVQPNLEFARGFWWFSDTVLCRSSSCFTPSSHYSVAGLGLHRQAFSAYVLRSSMREDLCHPVLPKGKAAGFPLANSGFYSVLAGKLEPWPQSAATAKV